MKLSGIMIAVAGLGGGLAAGSFFSPEIRHEIRAFQSSSAPPAPLTVSFAPETGKKAAAIAPPVSGVPGTTCATLLREENNYRRYRALAPWVARLQREDIPAALAEVEAGHGPGRDDLFSALASRWVEVDPEGALAAARSKTGRKITGCLFGSYYGAWAHRDPESAVAAVERLPDGGERGDAVWILVYIIGDRDPVKAQELNNSNHCCNFDSGDHFVYSRWADQELDQATEALLQPANFPKPGDRYAATQGIADRLLEEDPQAAVDWVASLPAGKIHDDALERLADQWSRTDPQAAFKWVKTLTDAKQQSARMETVGNQWAQHDPAEAAAYAATLPEGGPRSSLLKKSLDSWATADGAAAFTWAQTLPAPADRNKTLLNVIQTWANVDPAAAAASLQSVPEDPPGAKPKMAGQNTLTSFGYTFDLTDHSSRALVYAEVASQWAQSDPAQSGAWLNQLPAGTNRDAAVVAYSGQIANDNPAQAVQMAESMQDSTRRDQKVVDLLQKWMKTDPNSAASAVEGSPLPESVKAELRKSVLQKQGLTNVDP